MINAMRINGEDGFVISIFVMYNLVKVYDFRSLQSGYIIRKKVTAEPTIRVKFGTWQGDKPVDKQIFEKNSQLLK